MPAQKTKADQTPNGPAMGAPPPHVRDWLKAIAGGALASSEPSSEAEGAARAPIAASSPTPGKPRRRFQRKPIEQAKAG